MRQQLFGIIDANNFYISVERVFQPRLEGKAVVVLSNNDANIVARSNEAKALGITMGMPYFKAKPIMEQHGIEWFSSNYSLYGDLSRRVMATIDTLAPATETYSIDEAFVHLDYGRQEEDARAIRHTVKRWTGIPTSIGLGSTKVLAKVANYFAKRDPTLEGVLDLTTEDLDQWLARLPVGQLWGIGRRYEAKLIHGPEPETVAEQLTLFERTDYRGIETALELKRCPDEWIRKHFTIRGLRLVYELRGISCLPLEVFERPKKGLCCSRSFGKAVTTIEELREAIAMHAARGGEKLRRQRLAAQHLTAFISTSRYRINPDDIFSASRSFRLPCPTSYTLALVAAAEALLEKIYKPGYVYHKAGVYLADIVPDESAQGTFLTIVDHDKQMRLMEAVDGINKKHGRATIRPLAMGYKHLWAMRQERLSRRYTTRWDEVLTARA